MPGIAAHPSLLIRTLAGLVAFSIVASCNQSEDERTSGIVLNNMAFTASHWVAVVPIGKISQLAIVEIESGIQRTLRIPGTLFNGIAADERSDSAKFLVTDLAGGVGSLSELDPHTQVLTTIFRFPRQLRAPFRLGSNYCALAPLRKTTKQALDFEIVCDGKPSGKIVPSYSGYVFHDGQAIFLDQRSNETLLYEIEIDEGAPVFREFRPDHIDYLRVAGSADGNAYFYASMSGGRNKTYRWENEDFVETNDSLAGVFLTSVKEQEYEILLSPANIVLSAREAPDHLSISGSFRNRDGNRLQRTLTID